MDTNRNAHKSASSQLISARVMRVQFTKTMEYLVINNILSLSSRMRPQHKV